MDFDKFDFSSNDHLDESVNFRELLEKYTVYLKWFILSVTFFTLLAFLKVRYERPQYNIESLILIKNQEKGQSIQDLSSFQNMGLFGSSANSLENEIQIIRSRRLIAKSVKELNLNIFYFLEASPYDLEIYPNSPINLSFEPDLEKNIDHDFSFQILIKSDKNFEYFDKENNSNGVIKFGEEFVANFGSAESVDNRPIIVNLTKFFEKSYIGERMIISLIPVTSMVENYRDLLVVEPINENNSNVLSLSMKDYLTVKGISFVDNLVAQYNIDEINEKNDIAQKSIDFLDLRLGLISAELATIESTAEKFKTKNQMLDVDSGKEIFLQSSSVNESELVAANIQLQLANFMLNELNATSIGELLPGNIGLSDVSIVKMIGENNDLVLQRQRILKNSSSINPIIVNLDSQLYVLKNNLENSINNLISSLQIQLDGLTKQSGKINSKIASVPKNEREYKVIVRQEETKTALYLFLLQKREESEIAKSVTVENAKVIDSAFSTERPVSPKKGMVYMSALILGLFLPFAIIFIKEIFDTKIHNVNDLRKLDIPFLGDIPLSVSDANLYISENDNSNIAEAFRYVRTNINFMLDNEDSCKTVFVTSTQAQEGKTFTAINLASSLAISGKSTLLIGTDLRAPNFKKYFEINDFLGVTNFIKNENLSLNEITVRKCKFDFLDVIASGIIPPNPGELLMSKRVEEIFDCAKKKYDYIIVDTAPVGMVTDTIQISRFSDLTIYVIKANDLDKRKLHIPNNLQKEKKLPNMAILLNGSDSNQGAYGYGYGYGKEKKINRWYKIF